MRLCRHHCFELLGLLVKVFSEIFIFAFKAVYFEFASIYRYIRSLVVLTLTIPTLTGRNSAGFHGYGILDNAQ